MTEPTDAIGAPAPPSTAENLLGLSGEDLRAFANGLGEIAATAVPLVQSFVEWAVPQAVAVRAWAKRQDWVAIIRAAQRLQAGLEQAGDGAVLFGVAPADPARERLAVERVTARMRLPPAGGEALRVAVRRAQVPGVVRIGRKWKVDAQGRRRQLVPVRELAMAELWHVLRAWSWTEIPGGHRRSTRRANVGLERDPGKRIAPECLQPADGTIAAHGEGDSAVWGLERDEEACRELLRIAEDRSPLREAELIRLVYGAGLTRKEAAARMKIRPSTARVYFSAFKKRTLSRERAPEID